MNPNRLANPVEKSPFVVHADEQRSNGSGVQPIGTKVLVLTDFVAEKTAGGIMLPEQELHKQNMAVTTGTLVAIGGGSFTDWPHSDRAWVGVVPKVGQRVHLAMYAGILIHGKDGRRYRLIQDTDIAGVEIS